MFHRNQLHKIASHSFIQKVREIVNRRKSANHTLLFSLWAKAENDASDAGRYET
jgi:hypothetical protein